MGVSGIRTADSRTARLSKLPYVLVCFDAQNNGAYGQTALRGYCELINDIRQEFANLFHCQAVFVDRDLAEFRLRLGNHLFCGVYGAPQCSAANYFFAHDVQLIRMTAEKDLAEPMMVVTVDHLKQIKNR